LLDYSEVSAFTKIRYTLYELLFHFILVIDGKNRIQSK
jgi:hypothetical protein